MRKIICASISALLIILFNSPIYASCNEEKKYEQKFDGYLMPDYENSYEIEFQNGDKEGIIPLLIYNEDGSRNMQLPDGSQYRYRYMSGSHCWQYEFVIVGGFSSYRGTVALSPRLQTEPNGFWSTIVTARTDVVYLPYNLKGKSVLVQSGVVNGVNGKKYKVPYLPQYV